MHFSAVPLFPDNAGYAEAGYWQRGRAIDRRAHPSSHLRNPNHRGGRRRGGDGRLLAPVGALRKIQMVPRRLPANQRECRIAARRAPGIATVSRRASDGWIMRRLHVKNSAPLLILVALAGCDNVIWGGVDWQIVPPPPPLATEQIEPDAQTFAEFGLPSGPLVFHLVQGEGGSQLIPVAELAGDTLRTIRRPASVSREAYEGRFRETVLPLGAQFEVFRRGARVGTFIAQSYGPVTSCGVPTAIGNTTVVAAATDATDFLAYRQGLSPSVRGEYLAPQITGPIRTYASIVAERLILDAGLPRPRSWAGAQRRPPAHRGASRRSSGNGGNLPGW